MAENRGNSDEQSHRNDTEGRKGNRRRAESDHHYDRKEYRNRFADDNEHYGSGSGGGQWDQFYNEYDRERHTPYERHRHGINEGKRDSTSESNNDLRRDFEQGKGYANYGGGEGTDNYYGSSEPHSRSTEDKIRSENRSVGSHRGKGPRGYERSDARIREDVNDRLTDDDFIDASDIEVTVEKCEVTLSGTVDDRMSKRRAEMIAESVSGVKNVENRLRVGQRNLSDTKNAQQGNEDIGNKSSISGGGLSSNIGR